MLAAGGFIPALGLVLGAAAATWGLVSSRPRALLAAMIEGLVIVRGAHSASPAEMKRLTARAKTAGMQIALGRLLEGEAD